MKEIYWYAFNGCENLETIYVEDGCSAHRPYTTILTSTKVGPPLGTFVGGVNVWDLRELREIVIPDGVERIGNHWFYGTDVESVMVPASVREIGTQAFYNCKSLKRVHL